MQRAQGGDFAAFAELVARHDRRLYALAWHLTRNHHDAQDAVQNALVAAIEHFSDFRGEAAFATWITRVVVNHALKLLRRRRMARTVSWDALADDHDSQDGPPIVPPQFIADWREDPQVKLDQKELHEVLDQGLAQLPQGQRLVFVLRDIQGLSILETAEALGIRGANVKVRLLRARLALREYLTQRFGDQTHRYTPHPDHDHSSLLARLLGPAQIPVADQGGGDEMR